MTSFLRQLGALALAALVAPCAWAEINIAILDNDFTGYEQEAGNTIPYNTRLIQGVVRTPVEPTAHGLRMAQIVSQEIGTQVKFNLRLYQANGLTNFRNAITLAIRDNNQIILHALVRDYGGNFDGEGLFNAEVDRAIRAGILWINAAGNFGLTTYTGFPHWVDDRGWVKLPGQDNSIPLLCEPPAGVDTCHLRLILSWNDFSDADTGTNKDLDLFLEKASAPHEQVASSQLRQILRGSGQGYTMFPREMITVELPRGAYRIRVYNRSRNFTDKDYFRLATDDPYIVFPFHDDMDSLLSLADHPDVITVGAVDTPISSHSQRLCKPEVLLPSKVKMGGQWVTGSSITAARAAGRAAVFLSRHQGLVTLDDLLTALAGTDGMRPRWSRRCTHLQ